MGQVRDIAISMVEWWYREKGLRMNVRQAWEQGREILNDLGLGGWSLGFDRAKQRAGACHQSKQIITLSEHYVRLNEWEEIRNTILHEAAHALAGPGHGHDYAWRNECYKLGISPDRCYDPKNVEMPKGNIIYECPTHGEQHRGHRMPKRTYICRKCKSKLTVYREGTRTRTEPYWAYR